MNIICFPHRLGQKKIGVELAPMLFTSLLFKIYPTYKFAIHNVKCKNNKFHYYKNINNLYLLNKSIGHNQPRINIGGDHSMSIATVANSLNEFPNTKIIWIDAHADINTYSSSHSKNKHGMPLSYLTGIDYNKKYKFIKNKLKFDNLLYIGIRDIDPYEKKILKQYNINYISSNNINNNLNESIEKINTFLNGQDKIHISFDVDALDPCLFPHTGTKSQNGIQIDKIYFLLNYLYKKYDIFNTDIVEINPLINTNDNLIKNIYKIIDIFKNQFIGMYLK